MSKSIKNPEFEWVLFDLDNTLLDFNASSEIAFHKSFEICGIPSGSEDYLHYLEFNHMAWQAYGDQKMSHDEIKVYRFGRLFEKMNIGHLDPLEFNGLYFNQLVQHPVMIDGAKNLVDHLKGRVRMAVISNGMKEVQRPRLEFSGLLPAFDEIFISGEMGCSKPHPEFFIRVHQGIGVHTDKQKVLVIGDHLDIDIRGANDFGFYSLWYNPETLEKMNGIKPHFEVRNLNEIVHLLQI